MLNQQLYGVEICISLSENLQKANASETSPLFHVAIIKHFFDKLLCKLMLDGVWTN